MNGYKVSITRDYHFVADTEEKAAYIAAEIEAAFDLLEVEDIEGIDLANCDGQQCGLENLGTIGTIKEGSRVNLAV